LILHTAFIVKDLPVGIMSCYPQRLKKLLTESEQKTPDSDNVVLE